MMHWEKVQTGEPRHEFSGGTMYRGEVPGGWLVVMFWHAAASNAGGPSICFYPDPEHAWDGSTATHTHHAATA